GDRRRLRGPDPRPEIARLGPGRLRSLARLRRNGCRPRSVSMPEKPSQPNPPFDVRVIHQLVRLMKRYDLTAVNLVEGSTKINLRRRTDTPGGGAGAPAASPDLPVVSAPPPPLPRPEAAPPPPSPAAKGAVIESPMVGTYYA